MEAGLINNGETVIQVALRRCKDGVRVHVKVVPDVEDFFRHWGGGQQDNIINFGRTWLPYNSDTGRAVSDGSRALNIWSFGQTKPMDKESRSLWHPGRPLTHDGLVNISFLRIVGISAPEGLSFVSDELMSRSELEIVTSKVERSLAWFYREYINPVNMSVNVFTQAL